MNITVKLHETGNSQGMSYELERATISLLQTTIRGTKELVLRGDVVHEQLTTFLPEHQNKESTEDEILES